MELNPIRNFHIEAVEAVVWDGIHCTQLLDWAGGAILEFVGKPGAFSAVLFASCAKPGDVLAKSSDSSVRVWEAEAFAKRFTTRISEFENGGPITCCSEAIGVPGSPLPSPGRCHRKSAEWMLWEGQGCNAFKLWLGDKISFRAEAPFVAFVPDYGGQLAVEPGYYIIKCGDDITVCSREGFKRDWEVGPPSFVPTAEDLANVRPADEIAASPDSSTKICPFCMATWDLVTVNIDINLPQGMKVTQVGQCLTAEPFSPGTQEIETISMSCEPTKWEYSFLETISFVNDAKKLKGLLDAMGRERWEISAYDENRCRFWFKRPISE